MSALLGGSAHVMSITVGGDADKLLVLRVDGSERLSRLPQYTLDVVGNHSMLMGREKVDLHAMLGKKAHVTFDIHGSKRHIDAYVTRFQRGERHGRYDRYELVLQPWFWFATRSRNSRVFQNKSVKEIVNAVLDTYSSDYDWRLLNEAALPTLEYCLQYEESDYDFVCRLLEEYGIYFFFDHSMTAHTMVLVDAMAKHSARDSGADMVWSNKFDGDHCMTEWHTAEEARSVKAVVRDYDYLASATEIESTHTGPSAGAKLGDAEIYHFPAKVVHNQTVATSKSAASAATAVAKRIVEAAQSMQKLHTGTCNAHDMVCGVTFTLTDAPLTAENGDYLIVGCDFRAEYGDHEAISDLKSVKRKRDGFEGHILALDATSGVFRPERGTPRPRMYGPQIATVVGASANEIETDTHGRIKVQFPWDRDGKKDENSSCWVRVSQPWAGKKMGLWMLPRVGHEVVVSFIGGDPDRPLVTGSIHNDANPPPYELPKHADVATWISHSTKDGAADANNELRFCDTQDKEHVWFQGQKDFYRHVKGDTFDHLEMNETRKVVKTVKEVVGENWYLNVGQDVMHELGKDVHTKVAGDIFTTGGATWQVKLAKDYSLKVGADMGVDVTGKTALKSAGDVNVQTSGAMNLKATGNLVGEATGKVSMKSAADVLLQGMNIKAKGSAEIVLEATAGIKIVCGPAVITLGPAGVTIDGPLVKVNCGGGGGSAGAAESAAAAEPKAPEDAKNQEELTPGKATDYDKLLADPLAQPAGAAAATPPAAGAAAGAGAMGGLAGNAAALSNAAGGAMGAAAAAAAAAAGAAALGAAVAAAVTVAGAAAVGIVQAIEASDDDDIYDDMKSAEAAARDEGKTAEQTLADAEAAYQAAKQAEATAAAEAAAAANAPAVDQAAEDAAAAAMKDVETASEQAVAELKQAEADAAAAAGPQQTAEEVVAASDAAYAAAKKAEADAAAEAAAAGKGGGPD